MSIGYAVVRGDQLLQLILGSTSNHDILRTLPPLAEVSIASLTGPYPSMPAIGNVWKRLVDVYQSLDRHSPFGDLIQFEFIDRDLICPGYLQITFIAPLAFPKPALAADLVLFIRDAAHTVYWLGIERGRPPGVGKQALVGGFREVKPGLEHPVMNLIHEAPEELGVHVLPVDLFTADPYPQTFRVQMRLPGLLEESPALLKLIGSTQTDPASDYDPKTDTFRVHETCGYVGVLHAKTVLTVDQISAALHPTDKTEKTRPIVREVLRDSTLRVDEISAAFFSQHHRDLFQRGWLRASDELV